MRIFPLIINRPGEVFFPHQSDHVTCQQIHTENYFNRGCSSASLLWKKAFTLIESKRRIIKQLFRPGKKTQLFCGGEHSAHPNRKKATITLQFMSHFRSYFKLSILCGTTTLQISDLTENQLCLRNKLRIVKIL